MNTPLRRLVDKAAVTSEKAGREFLYSPAFTREACVQRESGSLLDRIFGGKLTPLVAAFVETGKLSAADLEELEAERVRLGIPESSILPARVESDAEGNYFIGGNPDDSKSRPRTSPPLTPAEKESIKAKLPVMAKEYGELITNWEALQRKPKTATPNDVSAIQAKIDDIVKQLKEKELEMASLRASVG